MQTSQNMKAAISKNLPWLSLLVVLFALLAIFGGCSKSSKDSQNLQGDKQIKTTVPIRLGWQPPWANQGQLVAILKNTDLLAKEGVNVEYFPFSYGGPMTEAAIAKEIDVVFAGEQPVLTLLSKSSDWRIVARMVRYRSAIVVPVGSKLQSLADLKGKTIAAAFGSTTHRDVVRILTENNLLDQVKLVSLDQAEQAGVIERGGEERWGGERWNCNLRSYNCCRSCKRSRPDTLRVGVTRISRNQ